jgi:1,4-alpha-glucan branching enzyme
MWAHPGKKLLFMGGELGQRKEWSSEGSLDWHLLEQPEHRAIQLLVGELDRLYRTEPALHELDCERDGFHWLVVDDAEHSTMAYERIAKDGARVVIALNFTPLPRHNYRVGVTAAGWWDELLNTDATTFGGSGVGNLGSLEASPVPAHGRAQSLSLTLPPLGAVFLRRRPAAR